ncbi:MAG: sigma factor-like helix-turn-helix DNA-binding protein, partial [Bacteroidota bacterium]
ECIELFYLKLKSYEEIATLTGYSQNEVKSHIQNGRRNLKLALNDKGIILGGLLLVWMQQAV